MCEELRDELDEGYHAACSLIEHLHAMGAASCRIPVEIDGVVYEVIVRKAD